MNDFIISTIIFGSGFIWLAIYDIIWFNNLQKKRVKTTKKGTYTFTPKEKKVNG